MFAPDHHLTTRQMTCHYQLSMFHFLLYHMRPMLTISPRSDYDDGVVRADKSYRYDLPQVPAPERPCTAGPQRGPDHDDDLDGRDAARPVCCVYAPVST